MVPKPNPNLPASDEEFLQLLEQYGGVSAMARALDVPQSTVSVRKSRIIGKRKTVELRQPTYSREPEWGLGGPQLVTPTRTSGDEVVVGLFDIHWPHHDKDLWACTIQALRDLQPDLIVLGGDLSDNAILSRWEQAQRSRLSPGQLFRQVRGDLRLMADEIFEQIRQACPNAVIRFIEGNHDERLRLWLMGEQTVEGIDMANEWMHLDDYGIIWHPRCGFLLRPEFLIRHGDVTVQHAAKAEFEKTKCGGWIGHGHRRREWYEEIPETGRAYRVQMSPVLCRRDYSYGPGGAGIAPWPQGFLVGTFSTTDQYDYETDVARWWNGTLLVRGRRY